MKQFEEEFLKEDWSQVRPDVEVKKIEIRQARRPMCWAGRQAASKKSRRSEAAFAAA